MKKVKLVLLLSLTLIVCVALVAGCDGSNNSSKPEEPTIIRIGGTVTDSHPVTIVENKFKELFEAATDGAYEVQVYTSCALGSPLEMLEAVQLGNLEIADTGSMILAPFTDMLVFMDIPYLFSNHEVAMAFADSEVARGIYDRVAKDCGIRPSCPIDIGFMTLSNTVRAIHTPEDLKGIKFRVQETPMYLKYFEEMGGSPMPMALSEVFTAVQQGTVDGITTQNAVFYSNGYQEIIEHISDMNPYYSICYLYLSEDWLQTLPDDIREILFECLEEASEYGRNVSREYIEEIDQKLETLCTVTHLTEEERVAFVESAEFMIDFFRDTVGDPYLDEYLAEIERIEKSLN